MRDGLEAKADALVTLFLCPGLIDRIQNSG